MPPAIPDNAAMLNKILALLIPLILPWILAWVGDTLLRCLRSRYPHRIKPKIITVPITPRPWWARKRTMWLSAASLLLLIFSLGYAAQMGVRF
ncbi:MAG: hypothetical protein ACKO43_07645 [Alphaproteobacteria bacterium]